MITVILLSTLVFACLATGVGAIYFLRVLREEEAIKKVNDFAELNRVAYGAFMVRATRITVRNVAGIPPSIPSNECAPHYQKYCEA